jgi:hypothetical protein
MTYTLPQVLALCGLVFIWTILAVAAIIASRRDNAMAREAAIKAAEAVCDDRCSRTSNPHQLLKHRQDRDETIARIRGRR